MTRIFGKSAPETALELPGLEEVNWAELEHAYGSAEDVPGLLRDLASRDQERGDKAMYAFYGNIWHQGTTYQATGYAVPFLNRILADMQSPFRAEILQLLVHLAFGHSYHDVHQSLSFFEDEREAPEFQAQIEREMAEVKRAHEAVSAGVPQYLGLWSDESPGIRAGAIYLAALFGEAHPEIKAALWRHLETESNTTVRATARARLTFGSLDEADLAKVEAAFSQTAPGLEKWALAACVLRYGTGPLREEAAREMIEALDEPEALSDYDALPFANEGLAADSTAQLLCLGGEARKFCLPLCEKLRSVGNQFEACSLLESIAPLFFGDFSQENPVKWPDLDQSQRELIRALNQTDAVWEEGEPRLANLSSTLRQFGLPSERAAMRALASNP